MVICLGVGKNLLLLLLLLVDNSKQPAKPQICTFPYLFSELIDVIPISFLRAKAIARTNEQETYRNTIIS